MNIRDATHNDLNALLGIGGFEPLLSIKQVTKILGVNENSVRRYIADGSLEAIRIGNGRGRVMVESSALRDYIRRARRAT